MKNKLLNKNVLVTTSNWFYAPDGKMYRAVYGTLTAITDAQYLIGFTPSRSHANWVYQVGNMSIMGCQVMYVIDCPTEPCFDSITDYESPETGGFEIRKTRVSHIYNANQ